MNIRLETAATLLDIEKAMYGFIIIPMISIYYIFIILITRLSYIVYNLYTQTADPITILNIYQFSSDNTLQYNIIIYYYYHHYYFVMRDIITCMYENIRFVGQRLFSIQQ